MTAPAASATTARPPIVQSTIKPTLSEELPFEICGFCAFVLETVVMFWRSRLQNSQPVETGENNGTHVSAS